MSQGSTDYTNSSILTDFTSTDSGTKSMRVTNKRQNKESKNKRTTQMRLARIEEELEYLRSKTNGIDWKLWVLIILTVLIMRIVK